MDVSMVLDRTFKTCCQVTLALASLASHTVIAQSEAELRQKTDSCTRMVAPLEQVSAASGGWWESQAAIMGTEVRVEVWHQDPSLACTSISKVFDEMRRIDAEMSPYVESSRLSQLNHRGAQGFVQVGKELFGLIHHHQTLRSS